VLGLREGGVVVCCREKLDKEDVEMGEREIRVERQVIN
jgi:hypothetical protein